MASEPVPLNGLARRLVEENIIPIIKRCRHRLLKHSGRIVPEQIDLWLCPVQSDVIFEELDSWRRRYRRIDLSPFKQLAFNRIYHVDGESLRLLGDPDKMCSFDLRTAERNPIGLTSSFTTTRTPITGKPISRPLTMELLKPFSTDGMYSVGMAPPRTSLWNSKS